MYNMNDKVLIKDINNFYYGRNGNITGITKFPDLTVYTVTVNNTIKVTIREDNLSLIEPVED